MSLVIPDEIIQATRLTAAELTQELAVALFQRGKLTLGHSSHLAGMNQWQFQQLLASRRIPIHYDVADFEADLQPLKRIMIALSNTSPITSLNAIESWFQLSPESLFDAEKPTR